MSAVKQTGVMVLSMTPLTHNNTYINNNNTTICKAP